MQFSLTSYQFISLQSKYSPQIPIDHRNTAYYNVETLGITGFLNFGYHPVFQ
jgi:hypothetical protein